MPAFNEILSAYTNILGGWQKYHKEIRKSNASCEKGNTKVSVPS